MESFFELAFPEVSFNYSGDTHIKCPFPHKLTSGEEYYEENASMSIDIEKGIYHCFSCKAKGNELQFMKDFMNITLKQANQLKNILSKSTETSLDWQVARELLHTNKHEVQMIKEKYMFTEQVIDKLQIGMEAPGRGIAFPVFLYDKLIDVISYNPKNKPKYRKRPGSENGIIMPYDEWSINKKPTVIVAGQKDLGIALSHNINAIAITGGEGEIPALFLKDFTDRTVYIVYDNDETGQTGAVKVANAIQPYAKIIKIINISKVCIEKGEDLWDYFVKYGKEKKDLNKLIKNTKPYTEEDFQKEKEKEYPTVSLAQASTTKYINKVVRSDIQTIATDEYKFLMPTAIHAVKLYANDTPAKNKLNVQQKIYWNYNIHNAKDLFYLIDNNLKEEQIKKNIRRLLKYPNEFGLSIRYDVQETIHKCTVADYFEATSIDDEVTEYTAYSLGKKLTSGNKYKITYKLVPNPQKGNALYMVIFDIEESQDSVSKFQITPQVIIDLKKFQVHKPDSLAVTISSHLDRVKGILNADYESSLLEPIDLWFHTPLKMDIGNQKGLRAYLDTLIVAESRVGKSTTVIALQETYGLGTRIPLNGHNSSIAGIIGGSHKTPNGFQIRAGAIPRAHKNAVILEELAKAKGDLLAEISELRSSGYASITRVSGTIHIPALVRMLTLTNSKATGAVPKPISSYPNGIEIVTDLVGKAEDIARYDMIVVLPSSGAKWINPFFKGKEPFSKQEYRNRIRWIWSRQAHQIIITSNIYEYVIKHANELNKTFDSHIKIFGTEAWLKIIRLATAIAGYVCSTDDTYQNIVVQKEHVDYAVNLLLSLYDNSTFRFRNYVEEERQYRNIDNNGIEQLEKTWRTYSVILKHLENQATTNQKNLQAVAGLETTTYNIIISTLVKNKFIRFSGYDIIPTERFRKGMEKINRDKQGPIVILR